MKVQKILNRFTYKGITITEAIDMKGYTVHYLKCVNDGHFKKISNTMFENIVKLYLKSLRQN